MKKGRDFVKCKLSFFSQTHFYKDQDDEKENNFRRKGQVLVHGFNVEIARLEILLVWESNEEAMGEERYGLGFWEEEMMI